MLHFMLHRVGKGLCETELQRCCTCGVVSCCSSGLPEVLLSGVLEGGAKHCMSVTKLGAERSDSDNASVVSKDAERPPRSFLFFFF